MSLVAPPAPAWTTWVGRAVAHVLYRTDVTGVEHVPAEGPVLVAANHLGFVDGPLLYGVLPRRVRFLVKRSMFVGPFAFLLRSARQIPVDTGNGRSALAVALETLRAGLAVGIFPEGARGRGDAQEARAGVAWLAVHGDALVLPVAVLGTRRTGEGVNRLPRSRTRLAVVVGPPLELPTGLTGRAAVAATAEVVRDALAAHVAAAVETTGIALPADDPRRERMST